MSECSAVRENMSLLLTESLDPVRRETAHQHIETCAACGQEWTGWKETWLLMSSVPVVEVPARVKQRFLAEAGIVSTPVSNVVPFHRRPAMKWLAQAAAVAIIAGGGYFAGNAKAPRILTTPAQISGIREIENASAISPLAIAETRVLNADAISPEIEGRPNIANVQFVDGDASDDQIGVSFDITSRWTVTGNPREKSMVRLLSYMLESGAGGTPNSSAMEWVKKTYSNPANADPEIANALAKVLRNDSHEGVRIRAVETLTNLPAAVASETREALIDALKNDPNPAVRIKAVEALANLVRNGEVLDAAAVDMLRQKASQDDENLYVRVKAAEALSGITP